MQNNETLKLFNSSVKATISPTKYYETPIQIDIRIPHYPILSFFKTNVTFWWRKKKRKKNSLIRRFKKFQSIKKKNTSSQSPIVIQIEQSILTFEKKTKKDGNEENDCSVIILAREGRGRRESISVPQRGTRTPVFPRSGEGFTGWRQTRAPIFRGSEGRGVHVSGCKYNRRVSRGEVKWPWRAVVHAE